MKFCWKLKKPWSEISLTLLVLGCLYTYYLFQIYSLSKWGFVLDVASPLSSAADASLVSRVTNVTKGANIL